MSGRVRSGFRWVVDNVQSNAHADMSTPMPTRYGRVPAPDGSGPGSRASHRAWPQPPASLDPSGSILPSLRSAHASAPAGAARCACRRPQAAMYRARAEGRGLGRSPRGTSAASLVQFSQAWRPVSRRALQTPTVSLRSSLQVVRFARYSPGPCAARKACGLRSCPFPLLSP